MTNSRNCAGFYTRLGGHFTFGAECNSGVPESLLDACAAIATYCRTDYVGKSYGGYDIFQDEKVKIALDTYVPNISVYIKGLDGERATLVLFWNYGGFAQDFRRGKWIDYIMETLLPRALEEKRKSDEAEASRREAEYQRRFGPIDDEVLFTKSPCW